MLRRRLVVILHSSPIPQLPTAFVHALAAVESSPNHSLRARRRPPRSPSGRSALAVVGNHQTIRYLKAILLLRRALGALRLGHCAAPASARSPRPPPAPRQQAVVLPRPRRADTNAEENTRRGRSHRTHTAPHAFAHTPTRTDSKVRLNPLTEGGSLISTILSRHLLPSLSRHSSADTVDKLITSVFLTPP